MSCEISQTNITTFIVKSTVLEGTSDSHGTPKFGAASISNVRSI